MTTADGTTFVIILNTYFMTLNDSDTQFLTGISCEEKIIPIRDFLCFSQIYNENGERVVKYFSSSRFSS